MKKRFKQKKHSAFTTMNGINKEMKVYEQWLMDIPEFECEILFQHNGKVMRDIFVYTAGLYVYLVQD